MLLRESSKKAGLAVNLNAVTGTSADAVGISNAEALFEIADAVCRGDPIELSSTRRDASTSLGDLGLVDAIAVAAAFNGITKVANATGLPLDQSTHDRTTKMRRQTGLDNFSERVKVGLYE